jgi:hypothetical protein
VIEELLSRHVYIPPQTTQSVLLRCPRRTSIIFIINDLHWHWNEYDLAFGESVPFYDGHPRYMSTMIVEPIFLETTELLALSFNREDIIHYI